jgi:hypothetical protein
MAALPQRGDMHLDLWRVSVVSFVSAGGSLALDRRVLAPVERVEVTVVIDNFLDVLMAGEEGVARYQARDLGAAEQLVAEHGFSALVSVERDGERRAVLYDAGLTPHAVAATSTCFRCRWVSCVRSSSRTGTPIITAASRGCSVVGGARGCRW